MKGASEGDVSLTKTLFCFYSLVSDVSILEGGVKSKNICNVIKSVKWKGWHSFIVLIQKLVTTNDS